jgi:UDP-glucose 4-epimerase
MIQHIKRSKLFVTGGTGFIGSHLVDRLIADGNEVTVYDNLVSGRKENIEHHQGKSKFRFIQADLLDCDTLKEAMEGHEVIWHLGANTDIIAGNRITDLDLNNCTIATRNVLEAMKQNGIDKVLFASSACVYGDVPLVPLSETYGPLLPISLYGAGKLACEGLLSAYSHLFGIRVWVFRFGNVVGARMGHGVIYDFIHKLKKNPKELEILGDGNQEKNFFLVEDCIDGMLYAFQKSSNQCDIFNLGCESTTKVRDIAQIVVEEMGLGDVGFRFTGGKRGWLGDAPYVCFDVQKMRKLGWSASRTSDEAVRISARRILDGSGDRR